MLLWDDAGGVSGGSGGSGGGDAVKVYVRIRPENDLELVSGLPNCVVPGKDGRTLEVRSATAPAAARSLAFDRVAPDDVTQAEVFEEVGRPMVEQCMSGRSGAIFVYGQTGSGKTHTMYGDLAVSGSSEARHASRGLVPRMLEYLFALVEMEVNEATLAAEADAREVAERKRRRAGAGTGSDGGGDDPALGDDGASDDDDDDDDDDGGHGDDAGTGAVSVPEYTVDCSFIEIYNESIFDLLHDPRQPPVPTPLQKRDAARRMRDLERTERDPWRAIAAAANAGRIEEPPPMDTSFRPSESPLRLRRAGVLASRNTVEALRGAPALRLREDKSHGVYVEGMRRVPVMGPSDAARVLEAGERNRAIGETTMNRVSSRGHTVFTFTVTVSETRNGVRERRSSRMHLVDLAGSERIHSQQNIVGKVQKAESASINKSLVALGSVISALSKHAGKHPERGVARFVPYRLSKLTHLLRDALGGNSRTCIVANISGNELNVGETLSTLGFATRAKEIRTRSEVSTAEVTKDDLIEQVQRLSRELLAERVKVRALMDLRCKACGAGFGDTAQQNSNSSSSSISSNNTTGKHGAGGSNQHANPRDRSVSPRSPRRNAQLQKTKGDSGSDTEIPRSHPQSEKRLSPRAKMSGQGTAGQKKTREIVVTPRHAPPDMPPKPKRRGGGRD